MSPTRWPRDSSRDILGKNLQLLRQILPRARRVGALVSPKDPLTSQTVADAKQAATSLGMELTIVEAETPAETERALMAMKTDELNAVVFVGGAGFYLNRAAIAAHTLNTRLPSMFQNREFVEAGGLVSYGPSTVANYRRAAVFVDRILKGARPADLPVEQPTQFELVINFRTARALGLTIPPSLLVRADQVIE